MERETLSNNTEYQEILREARIKGEFQRHELKDISRLNELDYEHRQLQQQVRVTMYWSDLDTDYVVECVVSELFPSLATGKWKETRQTWLVTTTHTYKIHVMIFIIFG